MLKFFKAPTKSKSILMGLSFVLSILVIVGVVEAATTIGTNITTEGSVTLATASSTGLAAFDSIKVNSQGDTVSDLQFGTCTVTLGSISASTTLVSTCAATGVTTSHKVFVTPYLNESGVFMVSASSTANNVIQIAVYNVGSFGAINPTDNTWTWMAVR